MRHMKWILAAIAVVLMGLSLTSKMAAQSHSKQPPAPTKMSSYLEDPVNWLPVFVPDRTEFFDNSKNWTTNYGPTYRDTVTTPTLMLACSPQFALCFHSGADPYPCHLSPDGRYANCLCTVQTATNYTVMTSINNYPVYLATLEKCGPDGTACADTDSAPVCQYLNNGALIPGAHVISTFDTESRSEIIKTLLTPGKDFLRSEGTLCRLHDRSVQEQRRRHSQLQVPGVLWSIPANRKEPTVLAGRRPGKLRRIYGGLGQFSN